MTDDVPGAAEMFRLLTRIDKRLDDMERRAVEREKDFVRVDVFEARQETDDVQMKAFENEQHSLSKRFDALDKKLDDSIKESGTRIVAVEERRRQDRMWLVGGLAFPLLVTLLGALLLSGRL
jgi:N12 class adenine-specific DNA methylase